MAIRMPRYCINEKCKNKDFAATTGSDGKTHKTRWTCTKCGATWVVTKEGK